MRRILILAALLAGCTRHDDTDPPHGWSNMELLQDNATGCQYLGHEHTLTPRIAADGKTHMGCKGAQP